MSMTLSDVLRKGRQADPEGVEVIMSRQACEEAADLLEHCTCGGAKTNHANESGTSEESQLTICLFKGCYGTAEEGGYCGVHQRGREAEPVLTALRVQEFSTDGARRTGFTVSKP